MQLTQTPQLQKGYKADPDLTLDDSDADNFTDSLSYEASNIYAVLAGGGG